jgi:hypothetical protein
MLSVRFVLSLSRTPSALPRRETDPALLRRAVKNVYSAFRFDPPSVGFAPIAVSDRTLQTLGEVPRSNATLLREGGSLASIVGGGGSTSAATRRGGSSWGMMVLALVGLMMLF